MTERLDPLAEIPSERRATESRLRTGRAEAARPIRHAATTRLVREATETAARDRATQVVRPGDARTRRDARPDGPEGRAAVTPRRTEAAPPAAPSCR